MSKTPSGTTLFGRCTGESALNILITGIAGDIGNGIGRILKNSEFTERLIGCDIHDEHMGQFVFHECELVSRADAGNYIDDLVRIARKHAVDAIIPTSEPELRFLLNKGVLDELDGIPLIMASREALRIGFDKLETARFLEKQNLPFPWTAIVDDSEPREFPCILKSRFGAGSKEVRLIDDAELVSAHRKLFPGHIWQELIGTADDEYTCGVYRSRTGEIRNIVFRRRLNAGITSYGVVVDNPVIDQLCIDIASAINLVGSINVQLRLASRGPVVFEINPRFSSTVAFRHKLGFEDVIWAISERIHGVLPSYRNRPLSGTKIFRKFDEVIL